MDSPDGELTYNGVVYNEMKGAFSSADEILGRQVKAALILTRHMHMSQAEIQNLSQI